MKDHDKYFKIVEWSEEDQCYVGSVPGWIGKCCHGDDEHKVYGELCNIVDEWINIYKQDALALPAATAGKSYSGKFVLRIDSELHKALAIKAMSANESLNIYCQKILKQSVTSH
ncbi:MAG: toxin-antitoxin system HicB family antitoxin [FCB group bacterium]|nr:toxin-antitoxin system HicB family antitoxin [FCB group bacterium]MBL7028904.1 toxin-antitoxin system HicB family antitoxin [Candidatus Neomarinimicrobiota bacterium]MBL7122742.1 toxin-antitoxin system HicB family antitoxin [Candidatus Neomarinimicrobiota bacterium]